MVKVISHREKVIARLKQAFKQTSEEFNEAMQTVIKEPRNWPDGFGTTYRQGTGETVVGSYRNIVDWSNLKDSQLMTIEEFKSVYTWDGNGITPVAIVFFGATLTNGKKIPPRDWVAMTLREINLSNIFAEHYNS